MNNNPPIEPSADIRALARTLRGIYLALIAEGFTERQAMQIVTDILRTTLGSSIQ